MMNECQKKYAKLLSSIKKTPEYGFAKTCVHCTDGADSFGHYTGTYCHLQQTHICDLDNNALQQCGGCKNYERRN